MLSTFSSNVEGDETFQILIQLRHLLNQCKHENEYAFQCVHNSTF